MTKTRSGTGDDAIGRTAPSNNSLIPREFVWILLLALLLIAGLVIAPTLSNAVYRNDPVAFAERSRPLLDGQLPYFDYEFEHLPLAIVPMGLAALIESLTSVGYTLVFWLLMSGILFGIAISVNRIGHQIGVKDGALRWVMLTAGLLPFLAFRVDALSVLLVLVALTLAIGGSDRRSAWAMGAAIAAKGWPIVLVVIDWWRGKRQRAVITVAATGVIGFGLTLLPLFRQGRSFFGVHIETFSGALIALTRVIAGNDAQAAVAAGASYVEVGRWAMVLNILLGLSLGLFAVRVIRDKFSWPRAIELVGVATVALMLLSPLLSAQFIVWITPFAALSSNRRVRIGIAAAAALTGVFVTFWYMETWWWWSVIVARNVFLLGTGWIWAIHLNTRSSSAKADSSSAEATE